MNTSAGEDFKDDLRARLPADVLRPLTALSDSQASYALARTLLPLAGIIALCVALPAWWVIAPAVFLIGCHQHALFILTHDAAHYRLYSRRWLNDLVGRALGAAGAVSMATYRVIHRLHHNHLYGDQDPDVALHGGYPRGRLYLLRKLAKDLAGFTAWKNYAYFFGHPALNVRTGLRNRPLDDTSARLRQQARRDRWFVVSVHLVMLIWAWWANFLMWYILLWLLPLFTVLQALLRLRALCEHGAVSDTRSALTAARTNWAPWWARELLFPHHMNYHLEHHLYPAVPHYNLPRLHQALARHGLLAQAEIRPVSQTLRRLFSPAPPHVA